MFGQDECDRKTSNISHFFHFKILSSLPRFYHIYEDLYILLHYRIDLSHMVRTLGEKLFVPYFQPLNLCDIEDA